MRKDPYLKIVPATYAQMEAMIHVLMDAAKRNMAEVRKFEKNEVKK